MKITELIETVTSGATGVAAIGANTPIAKGRPKAIIKRNKPAANAQDKKGNLLA